MTILKKADDDLEILGRIGSGVDGAIYRARQRTLNREVAIKVIHPEMVKAADAIAHARAIVAAGAHPNIVTTYLVTTVTDPASTDLVDVVVMELLDGEHLGQRWSGPKFSASECAALCNGLIDGVEFLHRNGVTHGDLHPGNVMWTAHGPRIIDLHYADQKSLPRATSMSREMRISSDIYNVGFIIAQSLKRADLDQQRLAELESELRSAQSLDAVRTVVRAVLASPPPSHVSSAGNSSEHLFAAIEAVEESRPARELRVHKYMSWLLNEFDRVRPDFSKGGGGVAEDEILIESLGETHDLIAGFARIAETVALVRAPRAGVQLQRGLIPILERCDLDQGFTGGTFRTVDFDFYRFLGHELFTTLVGIQLRHESFSVLDAVLKVPLFVETFQSSGIVSIANFAEFVELLGHRNTRLGLNRLSVQADLLKARHSTPPISAYLSFSGFLASDFFLALRTSGWCPWSAVFLNRAPRFLHAAVSREYADQLLPLLDLDSIESLKARIRKTSESIESHWRNGRVTPLAGFDVATIGSQ